MVEFDNQVEKQGDIPQDGRRPGRTMRLLEVASDEARSTVRHLDKDIIAALADSLHRRSIELTEMSSQDRASGYVLEFQYNRMAVPIPGTTWVDWSAVFENRKTGEIFFMLSDRRAKCGYGRSDRPLWQVFRDCSSRQIAIVLADAIDEALKNRR